jgi:hypothetical protein
MYNAGKVSCLVEKSIAAKLVTLFSDPSFLALMRSSLPMQKDPKDTSDKHSRKTVPQNDEAKYEATQKRIQPEN